MSRKHALALYAALFVTGAAHAAPSATQVEEAGRIKTAASLCRLKGGTPLMRIGGKYMDRPPVFCFLADTETVASPEPQFGGMTGGRLADVIDIAPRR